MNRMESLLRATGAVLAVSAVMAGSAAAQQPAALKKVNIGILYLLADGGIFVAKEKGYFAEQGLDVQLNRFTSGADVVALLATDRLDAGSGGATPGLFNAYIRGVQAPIVNSKAVLSPEDKSGSNLLIRTDLWESGKVRSAADMKGMKVVVNNIQSPSLNYVVRGLVKGGLTQNDVTMMEMPFDQFIPAMQRKAVDAVLAFSPLANTISDRMKLGVPLPEFSPAVTSTNDTANMMFYSPSFLKSEEGKAFMVAHLKGIREYHRAIFDGGDPTEVCGMIRIHLPFIPEKCAGISMSYVHPDGQVNVESLERYQNEWVQWGMMRERANIRANVDEGPLKYALEKLGKYQK